MNIQPNQRMDKAAFIAWNTVTEARCELVAGRVVEAPRVTRGHAMIVTNLLVSLRESLDRPQWEVLKSFGVEAGPNTLRYPDIVVDRAGGDGGDYTTTAPALLIEVLSPETATTDLGDKAAEYLQLSSLLAYIVLSQDEPKAWVYVRTGAQFTPGPAVIGGTEAAIRIAALQLELPMADIYAGIKVG
jgi:Uma2 family endonuclease